MIQPPLIAIVDDDDGVRLALDGLIRSIGCRVAVFDSAETFLESPCADSSRCIVSDIQMPGGMSGIELAKAIGAKGATTPVILISAYLDDKIEASANAAGVEVCLKKPFDGEILITCLERVLQR
ncbi:MULTISPECIES: response regulator transcription factor [Sphingomonas]|uniref:response regulator transcription factor n=1 Tax=Sphingomonas TaxID=13687 RepID=UPI001AEA8224